MKKSILLGLLITASMVARAQVGRIFHLDRLSKNDTLLGGWIFHAGDDAQWANTAYNDSKWKSIDAAEDIQQLRQLSKSGIGWIRLHIDFDTAVAKYQLAARIVQYSASEVYLNGKLIGKYGTISSDPDKVSAYLPPPRPFDIALKPHSENVLAVRLAYQPGVPYLSIFYRPLQIFSIYINDHETALDNYDASQHQMTMYIIIFAIGSGVLLIVSIIYFVYFLYDRSQKVNLYYALFTFALCINALPIEVWGVRRFGIVSSQMWVFFTEGLGLIVGMLMMVMTVYVLFDYRRRAVFYILTLIGAVATVMMYTSGNLGYAIASVWFPLLCTIEGVYACAWAIWHRKKNAAIILAGVICFTLNTISYYFFDVDTILSQSIFYIGQLSFPIGMSFYLSLQSSYTNKRLKTTLEDLQVLSAKNMAHEQEKQQLLASQNEVLEHQVAERTGELERSLNDLKATQGQLIQKEKMASLGELTAGIAHEIQNPLNFVNNFSEVSAELVDELNEELDSGDIAEARVIAADIKQNLQKINHHGKRADGIVKGMLEHSRSSAGEKQPTNLNAIADEFFKLSYHGLQAKDKSFNAELVTNFDDSLPKINVIAGDIGRVMLNLFNNAFYAVSQRVKTAGPDYKPTVTVTTFAPPSGGWGAKVKDNGIGIPDAIKDKIMQPFFTTKPTGDGTGLGLSLTYNIIKTHGGEIKATSNENEGTIFIIQLPIT